MGEFMSLLMDSLANATPVLKLRIETPVKFSSGNQMEMGKGRLFRSQSYHEYHNYLKAQLDDIYDDLEFKPNDGGADVKIMDRFFQHRKVPLPRNIFKTRISA